MREVDRLKMKELKERALTKAWTGGRRSLNQTPNYNR